MIRKQYKTLIDAPKEEVWKSLWGEETYPKWTRSFSPNSRVETNWEEGGQVLFLDGENGGMISQIQEKKENEKMVFRHLGMIDKDGNRDMNSEAGKAWEGAEEIYRLENLDGKTELSVEMDLGKEQEEFFDTIWPKVFRDLKEINEK